MSPLPLSTLAPDLTVPKLCLGTMTFGEQSSLAHSLRLLDLAFHSGINFYDTAEMYPVPQRSSTQGRSEEYIGHWIKARRVPRDRLVLSSKVAGPSGQMIWIREGPKCLDAKNILEAIDKRIGLLAYSPMAMGILSGKYFSSGGGPSNARMNLFRGRYSEGESRYNMSNPILKAAVKEYVKIATRYGLTPASLAIAFVLKHPLVASAVFGATEEWQVREVLDASKVCLTSEIVAEINEVHSRYPNPCP